MDICTVRCLVTILVPARHLSLFSTGQIGTGIRSTALNLHQTLQSGRISDLHVLDAGG